jgi:hypothetical protein
VEVQLHAFFSSVLDGGPLSFFLPGLITRGKVAWVLGGQKTEWATELIWFHVHSNLQPTIWMYPLVRIIRRNFKETII